MNRTEKVELATALKDKFSRAKVAIFVDYKGLTAVQSDEIRKQLRAKDAEAKVVKNNVARHLIKEGVVKGGAKEALDALVGPTMIAFGYKDIAGTAKVVHQFSKDVESFQIKDCLMGETRVSASGVEELASLPSREVLIAKMLGSFNAPITNFVGVLAAVPRSLVTVLSAIERKKAEQA